MDQVELAAAVSEPTRAERQHIVAERRVDWINPLAMIILGVMSTSFIYSAQAYSQGEHWKMQIVWFCIGFVAYFLVSITDYRLLLRYAHYIYGMGIVLLLLVFFGPEVYGSRRWIDFGCNEALARGCRTPSTARLSGRLRSTRRTTNGLRPECQTNPLEREFLNCAIEN